jgi:carboxypeptidase family protein
MNAMRRAAALSLAAGLTFTGAAGAQVVRGTVRMERGNAPAAHVIVTFSQAGREKARAITDPSGFYYIRALAAGAYDVKILRPNGVEVREARIAPAGGTVNFRIPQRWSSSTGSTPRAAKVVRRYTRGHIGR